jgi:hypothetical protein
MGADYLGQSTTVYFAQHFGPGFMPWGYAQPMHCTFTTHSLYIHCTCPVYLSYMNRNFVVHQNGT